MIKITKEKDGVYFTITAKLDREDAFELVKDLQDWLYNSKSYNEAKAQNDSKNKLSLEMQRTIEEAFADTYEITAEGKAIKKEKYDIVPSVIELEELKKQTKWKKKNTI
jgi:hypothetical protein